MAGARPRVKGAVPAVPDGPRVVVAAGGTAGHVVPAMAVADELRKSGAEVSFLGTREKAEAVRRARKLARKKLQREGLLPSKPAASARGGKGGPPGRGGPGGGGAGAGGGGFRGGQNGGSSGGF